MCCEVWAAMGEIRCKSSVQVDPGRVLIDTGVGKRHRQVDGVSRLRSEEPVLFVRTRREVGR